MQIEISEKDDPNIVGELLRGRFFDQSKGDVGCYTTFKLNSDVEELPKRIEEIDDLYGNPENEIWECARWNGIQMEYHWEHDGILIFTFPNGDILLNEDCKKTTRWEWGE